MVLMAGGSVVPAGSAFRILIEDFSPYYEPSVATVPADTAIVWDNPTATHHTVTHDPCESDGPCAFDSGAVAPNRSFTVPNLPPGQYPYHCRIHPMMRGFLKVTSSNASSSQT